MAAGYDYDFLEPIHEDYVCSVCLHVLHYPQQTSCCGNHFCKTCTEKLVRDNVPCPVCRSPSFTVFPDKFFLRQVNGLKVICPLGCLGVIELGSVEKHIDPNSGDCPAERPCKNNCGLTLHKEHLQQHYSVCPKRLHKCQYCHNYQGPHDDVLNTHWPKCKKYPVKCSMCKVDIQRTNVDGHRKRCPMRPSECNYCRTFKAPYQQVKLHLAKCPEYPVPCPNGCQWPVLRKNISHHLQSCPAQVIECIYKHAGCTVKAKRDAMPAHLEEESHSHLQLMDTAYAELLDMAANLSMKMDSLEAQVQRLKSQTPQSTSV